jgi:hypothetical protein
VYSGTIIEKFFNKNSTYEENQHSYRALFAILLISSCSASKKAHSPAKIMDGNWQLQTIVAEGVPDKIKANFLMKRNSIVSWKQLEF